MTAQRVGIIWNPSKTTRQELESGLTRAISAAGPDTEVLWFATSEDDAGQGVAAQAIAARADVVVAAGGDGTVRAVAERLAEAETETELAIVPLGTGNLLARNLEVPLGDVPAAFTRALTGQARALDVGWLEIELAGGPERHAFAVLAGFGLDAHMITETDDDLKDKVGWLAYVESMGRALAASDPLEVRITADGQPHDGHRVHTLLVGNCGTLQGGFNLLPDADPGDGELDLLLLSADGAAGWLDTMRNMVWDNGIKRLATRGKVAESSESATHLRVRSLRLELEEPRVFEIDGEDLGEATRVSITVQASAVWVR
ncbi:diacylglycerol/lipid kinase family protein [Promicromonospora iranensis]|uniref:Diacylglycerol kinase family enzyme n=1 Tax=Promicromonospora iranensis TaxID=1105144 RepID=A0ABU2CI92_9MICO|nr:diacylglycerol kinase family protein [Promicromonospora iranensis]MDR7381049.1 diacylglycerol kinase family enzyme [Promicromonospora iranensis]